MKQALLSLFFIPFRIIKEYSCDSWGKPFVHRCLMELIQDFFKAQSAISRERVLFQNFFVPLGIIFFM